jgi:hypothetical protein
MANGTTRWIGRPSLPRAPSSRSPRHNLSGAPTSMTVAWESRVTFRSPKPISIAHSARDVALPSSRWQRSRTLPLKLVRSCPEEVKRRGRDARAGLVDHAHQLHFAACNIATGDICRWATATRCSPLNNSDMIVSRWIFSAVMRTRRPSRDRSRTNALYSIFTWRSLVRR